LFPSEDAWIDRCDLGLSLSFGCATSEAFGNVIDLWCDQSGDPEQPEEAPWLVATSGLHSRGVTHVLRVNRYWSFSGGGKLTYKDTNNSGTIELSLQANPTRWLRTRTTVDVNLLRQLSPEALLHSTRTVEPTGLDGNDNYLPADCMGPIEPSARSEYRRYLLNLYFGTMREFLTDKLSPADDRNPGRPVSSLDLLHISSLDALSLRQAEIYWDLEHQNALLAVSAIKTALETLSAQSSGRHLIETSTQRDSVYVTHHLTKEIDLRIYAKCVDRVRFEIVHKNAQHIAQAVRRAGYDSRGNMGERLDGLIRDATLRMHRMWNAIRPHLDEAAEPGDFIKYSVACAKANVGRHADKVFNILPNARGIVELTIPREVLRSLLDVGILDEPANTRHGGLTKYPLQRRWCLMFDELKRQRRRQF
jgi:hypothetical protein